MEKLQLDAIVQAIESAFGDGIPFADRELSTGDRHTLERVFGDHGYQRYLQDQVNRQIIRDYLTNAVMLGLITDQRLAAARQLAGTLEGRAALSLQMLMRSVEEANQLELAPVAAALTPLRPPRGTPPELNLITS